MCCCYYDCCVFEVELQEDERLYIFPYFFVEFFQMNHHVEFQTLLQDNSLQVQNSTIIIYLVYLHRIKKINKKMMMRRENIFHAKYYKILFVSEFVPYL